MARNAALKYVAATKNIFRAYHTATALMKASAAIHTPALKRLRLKTRRLSRWRMLKIIIWKDENVDKKRGVHENVEDGFVDV